MYKYKHFILENIAPAGAKRIGVYDSNGKMLSNIPLGGLTPPSGKKLYSFCALSDIHLTYDTANTDFQRALTYAESNCDFTCIAGDLTSTGSDESQLALYKSIVGTYSPTKPVYGITGNHEHYDDYCYAYLEQYTGHPLYYSFTKGNDVFIMVGHWGSYRGDGIGWLATESWTQEELQWLYETLEANRNKRCFVFTHSPPHEHGVGNPNNLVVTGGKPLLWYVNDGGIGQVFISLLRHYKNTILFHGHSHTRFWLQELDKKANYSDTDGYRSVHIPSLAVPRDPNGTSLTDVYAESEGYIVDVYDNYIVLNGRDFIDNDADGHGIGIATYKIDTTLAEIPAGTFTDSTGTICKYKNLVKTATTEPGGTEIYNGTGYKDGYRWSSSGKTEVATDAGRITGWIPFVSGATYRFRNFNISTIGYASGGYVVKYFEDGTIRTILLGRTTGYDETTDTLTWAEQDSGLLFFRISAYKGDNEPIITMNEEIPE